MIRNTAGQTIGAQLINASSGGAFVGGVLVYVTGEDGAQALGTADGGVAESKGNGYFTYTPTQAETDFAFVAFTFIGVGAIPQTVEGPTITAAQAAASASSVVTAASSRSAQDIITGAFRRLNVFDAGDVIPPTDLKYGYDLLNEMVDSWNTERLLMSVAQRLTFPLVANQSVYTIGPTGDFVTAVPPALASAAVMPVGLTQEYRVDILTRDQYAAYPDKTLTNVWPSGVWFEVTSPNATLTALPVPTTAATLVLYVQSVLSQFATLTTRYSFNPGYVRALRENLAVELAPSYERTPSAGLVDGARESKRGIKMTNVALSDMATDGPLTGRGLYDINTDR